jgi:hypothetical protein
MPDDEECLELVPHITLNPSFNIEMLEHISPDYNDSRLDTRGVFFYNRGQKRGGGRWRLLQYLKIQDSNSMRSKIMES